MAPLVQTQGPPTLAGPPEEAGAERALTPRSLLTGLLLALVWTLAVCYMAVYVSTYVYQLLLVLGFGGLLTIFLLQYPRLYLVSLVGMWFGTAGLSWIQSTPEQKELLAGGLLRSLPVLGLLLGVGVAQLRRKMGKAESALVYALVAIAIPWAVTIKACLENSATSYTDFIRQQERQVFEWARAMPWWGPTQLPPPGQAENEARVLAALAHGALNQPVGSREALLALPPTCFYFIDHREIHAQLAALPPVADARELERYRSLIGRMDARIHWGELRPPALAEVPLGPQVVADSAAALRDREPRWAALEGAIHGFMRGSRDGAVPWGLWWRPMLYWLGMCGSFGAMTFGLLLMFRRRWLEHERLPFPWALPALAAIEDEPQTRRRRWVAWTVGLGICVPGITYATLQLGAGGPIPMIPWAGHQGVFGGFDLTGLGLLYKTPVVLYWGPLILAMFLLFPTDVLLTMFLAYVLFGLVGSSIFKSMGMEVGRAQLEGFMKWGIRSGGCAGLLIWGVYWNRKTIWAYLRSVIGAGPQPAGLERDELGRWFVGTMFVVGLVGFFTLGLYATSWPMMAFLTFWMLVYVFAQVRQRAEGMLLTYENNITSHQLVSLQRDFWHDHPTLVGNPQFPDAVATPNSWAAHWFQWGFAGQIKSYGPQNVLMEVFKVAQEVRANIRQVGFAVLLAMVVVAVLVPPVYLKLMYMYGFENTYQEGLSVYQSFTSWSERGPSYGIHSTSRVYWYPAAGSWFQEWSCTIWTIVGILIVGLLTYLRREYVWFPFSPVGWVLAAETVNPRLLCLSPETAWFSIMLAWAVKKLVFRWLGVRYYNERILPVVLFLLLGMMFGMLIYLLRYISMGKGILA